MIEIATGATFATQKCYSPPAVVESSRLIDTVNPHNFAIFVGNRSFQTVPRRKIAMNTLMSGTPISPLIGDSFAHQYSASVPVRVYAMPTEIVYVCHC